MNSLSCFTIFCFSRTTILNGQRDNCKMFSMQSQSCLYFIFNSPSCKYVVWCACLLSFTVRTFHTVLPCMSWGETKQIPAVYILEQSCKQPQASTQPQTQSLCHDELQTESVGHLKSGVSTKIVAWYRVDVHCDVIFSIFAPSHHSSCQGSTGTTVWQTGEVSVSYYSLIHASPSLCAATQSYLHPVHREVHTYIMMLV